MKNTNKSNTFFKQKRDFIKRIVNPETINWPREIKIMNSLWKKYPDEVFWIIFELTFKLKSLAWLIGDGKNELIRQWNFFQLDKKRKKDTIEYTDLPLFKYEEPTEPRTMKDWMSQKNLTNK